MIVVTDSSGIRILNVSNSQIIQVNALQQDSDSQFTNLALTSDEQILFVMDSKKKSIKILNFQDFIAPMTIYKEIFS